MRGNTLLVVGIGLVALYLLKGRNSTATPAPQPTPPANPGAYTPTQLTYNPLAIQL